MWRLEDKYLIELICLKLYSLHSPQFNEKVMNWNQFIPADQPLSLRSAIDSCTLFLVNEVFLGVSFNFRLLVSAAV